MRERRPHVDDAEDPLERVLGRVPSHGVVSRQRVQAVGRRVLGVVGCAHQRDLVGRGLRREANRVVAAGENGVDQRHDATRCLDLHREGVERTHLHGGRSRRLHHPANLQYRPELDEIRRRVVEAEK